MGEYLKFIIYFIIGGSILTLVTYYGRDKGILAAFIAMFPIVTVMSIITIYNQAGSLPVLNYVIGLLILTPIWILFLFCIVYLLPRLGLFAALGIGIVMYLILSIYIIYYL
jgi:hypothetical protein